MERGGQREGNDTANPCQERGHGCSPADPCIHAGSIPYKLCDTGQGGLHLHFILFKIEILMAATLKGS